MATLALDTSTATASVALARHGSLLSESSLPIRATHSETVLPEIERMMLACGVEPTEINTVVVGSGPGSFTGVRIAASLAKGICFARAARLFAYSSLAAVAVGTGESSPVCALFDAKRAQVYAAGYLVGGGIEELFPPMARALDSLLARLAPVTDWSFAGDGADPGARSIDLAGGRTLDRRLWTPRARSLLWLAGAVPELGQIADPRNWEPRYVRLPAAQRELGD